MVCHGAQLMGCPKCGEVYCVPAVVGPATVFHAVCGVALTLRLSADSCSEVTRAVVVFSRDHNQLEVALAAEGS
jgi:hypothetical protein